MIVMIVMIIMVVRVVMIVMIVMIAMIVMIVTVMILLILMIVMIVIIVMINNHRKARMVSGLSAAAHSWKNSDNAFMPCTDTKIWIPLCRILAPFNKSTLN